MKRYKETIILVMSSLVVPLLLLAYGIWARGYVEPTPTYLVENLTVIPDGLDLSTIRLYSIIHYGGEKLDDCKQLATVPPECGPTYAYGLFVVDEYTDLELFYGKRYGAWTVDLYGDTETNYFPDNNGETIARERWAHHGMILNHDDGRKITHALDRDESLVPYLITRLRNGPTVLFASSVITKIGPSAKPYLLPLLSDDSIREGGEDDNMPNRMSSFVQHIIDDIDTVFADTTSVRN